MQTRSTSPCSARSARASITALDGRILSTAWNPELDQHSDIVGGSLEVVAYDSSMNPEVTSLGSLGSLGSGADDGATIVAGAIGANNELALTGSVT